MASPLRTLGLVGAILILAGATIAGVGFLNTAIAESTANSCQYNPPATGCGSDQRAANNASTLDLELLGVGFVVGGVGAGLLFIAAIGFMSRWPPRPPPGAAPPVYPPPASPPGGL
jgi:hypothetical protein